MLIGKKFKIESDEFNVTLYERKLSKPKDGKPSKEYWTAIGYYSTVANTLKALVNLKVHATGLKDLQTVVNKIDELAKQIDQTF